MLNACGCFDARILTIIESRRISWEDLASGSGAAMDRLGMKESARKEFLGLLSSGWYDREVESCESMGVRLIFSGDPGYPSMLADMIDPPLVLYESGSGLPSGERVAVVGTRRCTSYGSNCASDLASVLVDVGVAVVSGGARGIDAAAHRGCMSSGGRTVAVTGTGADISYPASHSALFREIREEGCLLTEFPLGTPPRPWNFPRRNRLIAGLCSRCVVVEAPEKSGAVLTARLALEAGREVWAVPGRITDGVCKGSNALISDGAMPLVDIRVFAALVSGRQGALFPTGGRREDTAGPVLTPEEAEVLRILADHGEMTVDNISAEGKMSAAVVLRGLGVLSAYGLVAPGGPGRWSKRTQGRG
ncbi:MAG TPA: DNA-processing protein DprA [Synergistales bacterium]|nr:DNA-processing protein DprA [Synergistales bacterium]MDI9393307.1 DNA-processing protein DprA [Synergistota bacterium]NLV65333.1 DNA-protecting protein DprA [Synergistaceae bacterium]HRW88126.1 DNA-processing protein DprA [Thermovirgaceae bacterium]MDD3134096.1 DNA-processing protein DprA [Synergistales bacterium]